MDPLTHNRGPANRKCFPAIANGTTARAQSGEWRLLISAILPPKTTGGTKLQCVSLRGQPS